MEKFLDPSLSINSKRKIFYPKLIDTNFCNKRTLFLGKKNLLKPTSINLLGIRLTGIAIAIRIMA